MANKPLDKVEWRVIEIQKKISKLEKERSEMWSGDIAYKMNMAKAKGLLVEYKELMDLVENIIKTNNG